MRTTDISRRSIRGLKNAKTRTVLTSLAIAVGAFTITISLAAGEGTRQYADNLINSNVNPQSLFIVKDKSLFEGGPGRTSLTVYNPDISTAQGMAIEQISQADVDRLTNRSELTSVVPIYRPTAQFMQFGQNDKKFAGAITTYNSSILGEVAHGTLPSQGTDIAENEAVVPSSYADVLKKNGVIQTAEELVGMKVTLTATRATATPTPDEITNALQTGGQSAVAKLLKPETKQFIFTIRAVSQKSAEALTSVTDLQIAPKAARAMSEFSSKGSDNYQKYLGVTAIVKDGLDPQTVKESLASDGFYAQTSHDLQGVIFAVVNTLQGIVLGFGIIALIASVFGIINTQYISVLERTREIGLMKALGMRGSSVSRLFQFEAAWIGFLGGIIGAAIAVVVGSMLNPWITDLLSLSKGTTLLVFQIIPTIVMIVVLVLIAMLAGWFPARKAAKLDPIEALRTE